MREVVLQVFNPAGRDYIQGAATTKALLAYLQATFTTAWILDFTIRFLSPQMSAPRLRIYPNAADRSTEGVTAQGTFMCGGKLWWFVLTETGEPVKTLEIDEEKIKAQISEGKEGHYMHLTHLDDVQTCWTEMAKYVNLPYFRKYLKRTDGRMILTGLYFNNLVHFSHMGHRDLAIDKSIELLTPTCIRQKMYLDGKYAGLRTSIYSW